MRVATMEVLYMYLTHINFLCTIVVQPKTSFNKYSYKLFPKLLYAMPLNPPCTQIIYYTICSLIPSPFR